MKRRQFLFGLGGVTVLLAGGGVWRAVDRGLFSAGQGEAYAPWQDWREARGTPLALVRAAILAANPHNTQPWAFRVTEERITLYADTRRHLGTFDPFLREMYLGLGCALENMLLASGPNGYVAELTMASGRLHLDQNRERLQRVAEIRLAPGSVQDNALFEVIGRRHTHRGPYREVPLARSQREGLQAQVEGGSTAVVLVEDEDGLAYFRDTVVQATRDIIRDEPMVADSERWFRHSREEIRQHRDGPTLDAAGLSPMTTALAKLLPRPSAQDNHRYWLEATERVQVATAPAMGMILVDNLYDIPQTLAAGRTWQRMHLWATSQGLAMQPLNQPVERVDREEQLQLPPVMAQRLAGLLPTAGQRPTFAFRVGVAAAGVGLSPRRSVESTLIGAEAPGAGS